ncbi:MAG: fasciclin domain-containing protein [Pseudomonadota bacterium]
MKPSIFLKAGFLASALAVAGCASMPVADSPDIVDVAQSAGSFTTLVAAVSAADLVETLQSDGPFTVFAPTDAAFAALPAGTVEELLEPESKDQLVSLLTYHVLPGRIMAGDLAGQQLSPATVNGETLEVDGRSGVTVNGANVVQADIEASNGVIHVIDTVLLP